MPRRNKIKVGLPVYGAVPGLFFHHWMKFQGELGRLSHDKYAGLMTVEMPYVDRAENTIVDQSLRCTCEHVFSEHIARGLCNACTCEKLVPAEEWDYLVLIEHDNTIPDGWVERILAYDKPIVSLIYFGKAYEDQRPIPGFLRGPEFIRLSHEEVEDWIAKPGFYEVDCVGMGATAIRRDVLEKWDPWKMPWFQTKLPPPNSVMGQDIYFCLEARKQGHKIYVDTHQTAGHIGTWTSSLSTFRDANELRKYRDLQKRYGFTLDQMNEILAKAIMPAEEKGTPLLLPSLV